MLSTAKIVSSTNDFRVNNCGVRKSMLTSITRWVLAHKRFGRDHAGSLVTIVGIATVSSVDQIVQQLSSRVPGREGYRDRTSRSQRIYLHTAGDNAPLLAVVTLPAGTSVSSPAVESRARAVAAKLQRRFPAPDRVVSRPPAAARSSPPTARTTFVIAYPPPDPTQAFETNPQAAKTRGAALRGRDGRRARRVHRDRASTRCQCQSGGGKRAGRAASRRCSAASARCWCWRSCSARSLRSCRC